jgi:hypothetical protein
MNNETLAIRVTDNPDHHLWLNNGTWFVHFTLHASDYTKRRMRISLKTHDLVEARRRRDRLLERMASKEKADSVSTAAA